MTCENHPDMEQTLSFLIVQVARAHRARAQQRLSEMGLYVGQEQILIQLWDEDGVMLTDLAQRMCLQPATITKMLNRMEKSGLLERRPDPEDGRAKRIYLTETGHQLKTQTQYAWGNLDADTTHYLNKDEEETLQRLLQKVLDGLTLGTTHDTP